MCIKKLVFCQSSGVSKQLHNETLFSKYHNHRVYDKISNYLLLNMINLFKNLGEISIYLLNNVRLI